MKLSILGTVCLTFSILLAAGCTPTTPFAVPLTLSPIPSPSPGFQPDPCNAANLPSTIKPLNDLMREFDDYASLASNVMQSELVKVIPALQAIRRATEDHAVPACLADLKRYALLYMDTTIQALLAFQSNAPANAIATRIAQTRQSHDLYAREAARILGVTLPAPEATGSPVPTQTP